MDEVCSLSERIMPLGMKLLTTPVRTLAALSPWARRAAASLAFARLSLRLPDSPTLFKGRLGEEKRVAWSDAISLERVQTAQRVWGGTLNDLLMTAAAGGLRRYIESRGESPDGVEIRAVVPVNLRPLEKMSDMGNRFGLVFVALPAGIADPVRRLVEVKRRMAALKRSGESIAVFAVLRLMGRLPRWVHTAVLRIFAIKASAVLTNVPGPAERLLLAGVPVRDLFFWVPQGGCLSMGLSILSYAGSVRLGVATDAGLVPDPERIVAGFQDELEAMLDLALVRDSGRETRDDR